MISKKDIDKLLSYNPMTGILQWKVSRGTKRKGSVAGTKTTKGTFQCR